jgi:transposase InsO family protein
MANVNAAIPPNPAPNPMKYGEAKKILFELLLQIPWDVNKWEQIVHYIADAKTVFREQPIPSAVPSAALDALKEALPKQKRRVIINNRCQTTDAALDLLLRRFGDADVTTNVDEMNDLSRLFQKEGQKIAEFFSDLEDAYIRTNPNADLTTAAVQRDIGGWLETKVLPRYSNEIERIKAQNPNLGLQEIVERLKKKEREFDEWGAHRNDPEKELPKRPIVAALNPNGEEVKHYRERLEKEEKWCWGCGVNPSHATPDCVYITHMREEARAKHGNLHVSNTEFYCVGHLSNLTHHTTDCRTLERHREAQVRSGASISAEIPEIKVHQEKMKVIAAKRAKAERKNPHFIVTTDHKPHLHDMKMQVSGLEVLQQFEDSKKRKKQQKPVATIHLEPPNKKSKVVTAPASDASDSETEVVLTKHQLREALEAAARGANKLDDDEYLSFCSEEQGVTEVSKCEPPRLHKHKHLESCSEEQNTTGVVKDGHLKFCFEERNTAEVGKDKLIKRKDAKHLHSCFEEQGTAEAIIKKFMDSKVKHDQVKGRGTSSPPHSNNSEASVKYKSILRGESNTVKRQSLIGKRVRFLLPLDEVDDIKPGHSELKGIYFPKDDTEQKLIDLDKRSVSKYWMGHLKAYIEDDANYEIKLRSPKLIALEVDGVTTKSCCVDSGSAADLIDLQFLRNSGIKYKAVGGYRGPALKAVGGHSIELLNIVRVEIEIGGTIVHSDLIVAKRLPFDVLLGTPFLDSNMAILDHGKQMFSIHDSLPVPFVNVDVQNIQAALEACVRADISRVISKDKVILRPRTTTPVTVIVKAKKNEDGFITPISSDGHDHMKVIMPKLSLVDVDSNSQAVISLVNPTHKKIVISRNTLLGCYRGALEEETEEELMEISDESIFGECSRVKSDVEENVEAEEENVHCDEGSCKLCSIIAMLMISNLNMSEKEKSNECEALFETLDVEQREVLKKFEISKDTSDEQQKQLLLLLLKYKRLWWKDGDEQIQHLSDVEHGIETEKGVTPIRSKLRNHTRLEQMIISDHLDKMITKKVIRPSNSPWASPVLLADKKNGKVRFCVDYRRLNKITRKDAYPLPNIGVILDKLGGKKYYSTIDLREAFWQIRVKERDIEKTAFITHRGLFEFVSMPFGLTNAPATQQRWIEQVLMGLNWAICMVYIDDIVIFSNSFEEHLKDLESVLQRLEEKGMSIAPEKCGFCKPSFEILGHICTRDGIAPNPAKIEAIRNYPRPTNKDELGRFLGMISWVRRFIVNCSERTAPLREMSKLKDKNFKESEWNAARLNAFEDLKGALMTAPVLVYPDFTKEFFLHVDASGVGLGAVLTQKDDKNRHVVIAYASTSLNDAQKNYPATVKECLGILWALNHYRQYLHGQEFTLFTDHKALVPTLSEGITTQRMLRDWTARIAEYNPKIVHRPGRLMLIPDALSRVHYSAYCDDGKQGHILCLPTFSEEYDRCTNINMDCKASRFTKLTGVEANVNDNMGNIQLPDVRTVETVMKENDQDQPEDDQVIKFPVYNGVALLSAIAASEDDMEIDETGSNLLDPSGSYPWSESFPSTPALRLPDMDDEVGTPPTPPLFWDDIVNEAWPVKFTEEVIDMETDGISDGTARSGDVHLDEVPETPHTATDASDPLEENGIVTVADDIRRLQREDPFCRNIIDLKTSGTMPNELPVVEKLLKSQHCYRVDEVGLLRRVDIPLKEARDPPIVLPNVLRKMFIEWFHSDPLSGHLGFAKTYARMRERYWFPNMHRQILDYCHSCVKCQLKNPYMNKHAGRKAVVPMNVDQPMNQVHVDTTKGSGKTPRGNTHIVTFVDHFSGFVKAYAVSDTTALTIAMLILDYVCDFGTPATFYMDNGSEYYAEVEELVPKLLGSHIHRIAPYNPQANSKVERWHRTLKSMLKAFVNARHTNWDILLPLLQFAVNTSINDVTKYTPYYIYFGRPPRLPIELAGAPNYIPVLSEDDYLREIQLNMAVVYDIVRTHVLAVAEETRQRTFETRPMQFEPGDIVVRMSKSKVEGLNRKFLNVWNDVPLEVVRKVSPSKDCTTYILRDIRTNKLLTSPQNVKLLRPFRTKEDILPGLNGPRFVDTPEANIDIVDHRLSEDGHMEYRVQRFGYSRRSPNRYKWLKESEIPENEMLQYYKRLNFM